MNRFRGGSGVRRNRAASIGVRVREKTIDRTTAALRVKANSRISRPTTPPMNINGVNTAIRETEIDRMVKLRMKGTFYSQTDIVCYLAIIQCMIGRPDRSIHLFEKIASESAIAMYNLVLCWICVNIKLKVQKI